jgi:L-ascorbate metabolism protein UlaG (beta-lactamase superfamily)
MICAGKCGVHISDIRVDYLAHVCFRFVSPTGSVVFTDPFFADGFPWEGHWERYLSPPDVDLADISRCDAIFISHIHGDHCDPQAVTAIHRRTGCRVVAPADVLELLAQKGADPSLLCEAKEGARFTFGDVALTTYCGYDDSFDARGRPNKFSLVIECGPARLFYSGDCHALPPGVRGMEVDAMFCWPHPDEATLKALCSGLRARKFVLMHCDRFEPGAFFCNQDFEAQKRRVESLVPGISVIAPERATVLSSDP